MANFSRHPYLAGCILGDPICPAFTLFSQTLSLYDLTGYKSAQKPIAKKIFWGYNRNFDVTRKLHIRMFHFFTIFDLKHVWGRVC